MTNTTKSIASKPKSISLHLDQEYKHLFTEIKTRIQTSRLQAALAVNREVIRLYWFIGKKIIEKQAETNWGDKLLETLSNDLQLSFPETYGFSKTNLKYMRIFAYLYPDGFGQHSVDQIPWGHIMLLIQRVKDGVFAIGTSHKQSKMVGHVMRWKIKLSKIYINDKQSTKIKRQIFCLNYHRLCLGSHRTW
jgi:predicted nuclease of restriction endonuclease-like (RecB) superfamily